MHAEKAWSIIDDRPVLKYVSRCDDYIVYWNGIVMPHKMALCLAGSFFGIFPTPKMIVELEKNYRKLYYADAFGVNGAWDHTVKPGHRIYSYLQKIMNDHLASLAEKNIPKPEILGWFNYERCTENV